MVRLSRNRLDMEDGRIDRPIIKDYGETVVGGSAGTNAGSAYDCNIQNGNVFNLILNSANCTFTFSNPSPPGIQCIITLYLTQDATGGRNVIWPSSVKWPGDVQPNVTTASERKDVFVFFTIDGGSTWYGGKSSENIGLLPGSARIFSWGNENFGYPGGTGLDTSIAQVSSPVQLGTVNSWTRVASGYNHTHALKSDGSLWTWGTTLSALGTSASVSVSSPVQVGTDTSWADIRATPLGGMFFGIKNDGSAWVCGGSTFGTLGLNNTASQSTPTRLGLETNWLNNSIATGNSRLYFVKASDGTLWTNGRGTYGALGHNDIVNRSSPTQVGTLTDWRVVSAGRRHAAAIKTDGTLWTWGEATNGKLGNNGILNMSSPVQIGTLTDWAKVSAGMYSTIAIKNNGTLWSWGVNSKGDLGLNNIINRSSPVQVGAATDWSMILNGKYHNLAIKTNGTLWAFGQRGASLGINVIDGTAGYRSSPVQVGTLTDWIGLAIGENMSFGLRSTL